MDLTPYRQRAAAFSQLQIDLITPSRDTRCAADVLALCDEIERLREVIAANTQQRPMSSDLARAAAQRIADTWMPLATESAIIHMRDHILQYLSPLLDRIARARESCRRQPVELHGSDGQAD